eukprot:10279593-Karenia_brevis.AAC.1
MEPLETRYSQCIPTCQHGAVKKKGADLATHVLLLALEVARRWQWCVFILYVDLSKAFDRIVRELVMGIPASCNVPLEKYLREIGIPHRAAKWIAEYLQDHGCILEQWGVPLEVIRLICSLHDHCWFRYGSEESMVVTKIGARQGCKSGPIIFNAGYSIILSILQVALSDADICLRLRKADAAFWLGSEANSEHVDVIDVTFVDDEAVVLVAPRASVLDHAIGILMEVIAVGFANLDFK